MIKHMLAFRFKPDLTEFEQASMIAELNDFSNRLRAMGASFGRNISRRAARSGIASRPSSTETQNCTPISNSDTHETLCDRASSAFDLGVQDRQPVCLNAAGSVRLRRKVGRAQAHVNGRGRHGRLQHDTLCRGRRRLVK